jgi:hypothetical protein
MYKQRKKKHCKKQKFKEHFLFDFLDSNAKFKIL